jgi:carbamoyltransferase
MNIGGFWSGHDCSYCILDNGVPTVHNEYERFIREKEPQGDGMQFLFDNYENYQNIKYFATCFPLSKTTRHNISFEKMKSIAEKNGGNIYGVGHHQAHAANAFFSSNLNEATIITLDGGGVEQDNVTTACTIYLGKDNKISNLHIFSLNSMNIGGVWTRSTRYIFNLQSGWPRGHQAGSVMAMAAFGNRQKYFDDFMKMLTIDNQIATMKPSGQPKGANVGTDPIHPYLGKYREIADRSEQDKFDLAASLQAATEARLKDMLKQIFDQVPTKNLCLAGGVVLNCVAIGKIKEWFPFIENIYIPPAPHDGGLSLGAAQYVWHQVLDNPRINWKDNKTPYLGKVYAKEEIINTLNKSNDVIYQNCNDEKIIELLSQQKIISVFGGGSESGRRALGNRSILADPRSDKMKDLINEKVKHRQWYRPFAPSMLREKVGEWFDRDDSSPYMNIVLNFKKEMKDKVPAVVHCDGTARVQTVTSNDNPWYYNFLKSWEAASGVPIILNTSFNDREPICETPEHAINCFLGTNIDYLYFYDYQILVEKEK